MNILAFDTAQDACSAAAWSDGAVVGRETVRAARGHAELLFPMLARVLDRAGLDYAAIDRFAVTIGPGSFTGVRVGVAAARGLMLARAKPAVGVTTLEAIAATAAHSLGDGAFATPARLAVAIDARRDEIYFQIFDMERGVSSPAALTPPAVLTLDEAARRLSDGPVILVGSGAPLLTGRLRDQADILCPNAPTVADAGILAEIAAARRIGADMPPPSPLYLRSPDAKLPEPGRTIPGRAGGPDAT